MSYSAHQLNWVLGWPAVASGCRGAKIASVLQTASYTQTASRRLSRHWLARESEGTRGSATFAAARLRSTETAAATRSCAGAVHRQHQVV